jgi:hypothetical protein
VVVSLGNGAIFSLMAMQDSWRLGERRPVSQPRTCACAIRFQRAAILILYPGDRPGDEHAVQARLAESGGRLTTIPDKRWRVTRL